MINKLSKILSNPRNNILLKIMLSTFYFFCRVFQEMLYGIQAGFGSPQVPVAELLARPAPTLLSPQKPKSSNFLQVPDMESPR